MTDGVILFCCKVLPLQLDCSFSRMGTVFLVVCQQQVLSKYPAFPPINGSGTLLDVSPPWPVFWFHPPCLPQTWWHHLLQLQLLFQPQPVISTTSHLKKIPPLAPCPTLAKSLDLPNFIKVFSCSPLLPQLPHLLCFCPLQSGFYPITPMKCTSPKVLQVTTVGGHLLYFSSRQ